jgi:low affinity Fe/Cu permease
VSGPFFGFSDTWQLVINTGTTIVTFLMVFLIQNTQNRDALAMHLKLDEVIRAIEGADNTMIQAEDETIEELERLKSEYEGLYTAHKELKSKFASGRPLDAAQLRDAQAASPIPQSTNGKMNNRSAPNNTQQ